MPRKEGKVLHTSCRSFCLSKFTLQIRQNLQIGHVYQNLIRAFRSWFFKATLCLPKLWQHFPCKYTVPKNLSWPISIHNNPGIQPGQTINNNINNLTNTFHSYSIQFNSIHVMFQQLSRHTSLLETLKFNNNHTFHYHPYSLTSITFFIQHHIIHNDNN